MTKFMVAPDNLHLFRVKPENAEYSAWILGRHGHGKPLAKPSVSSYHAEWTEAIARARPQ